MKRQARPRARMRSLHGAHQLAVGGIIQQDLSASVADRNHLAVGTKGNGCDRAGGGSRWTWRRGRYERQLEYLLPGRDIPNDRSAIVASGDQARAVGRKIETQDPIGMSGKFARRLGAGQVEQGNAAAIVARRK